MASGRQAGSWRGDSPWWRHRIVMEVHEGPPAPLAFDNSVTMRVDYYLEMFDPNNPEHVASWEAQTATNTWWRRWTRAVRVSLQRKPR